MQAAAGVVDRDDSRAAGRQWEPPLDDESPVGISAAPCLIEEAAVPRTSVGNVGDLDAELSKRPEARPLIEEEVLDLGPQIECPALLNAVDTDKADCSACFAASWWPEFSNTRPMNQ